MSEIEKNSPIYFLAAQTEAHEKMVNKSMLPNKICSNKKHFIEKI